MYSFCRQWPIWFFKRMCALIHTHTHMCGWNEHYIEWLCESEFEVRVCVWICAYVCLWLPIQFSFCDSFIFSAQICAYVDDRNVDWAREGEREKIKIKKCDTLNQQIR